MKMKFFVLATLLSACNSSSTDDTQVKADESPAARSGAAQIIWSCDSAAAPSMTLRIYSVGDKLTASLTERMANGRLVSDTIELDHLDNGSDSVIAYRQAGVAHPRIPGVTAASSNRTSQATVVLNPFTDSSGTFTAAVGPAGEPRPTYRMTCRSAATRPQPAPRLLWRCNENSDPDFARVSIFAVGDTLVAHLYEEAGDGDTTAFDNIEIRRAGGVSDATTAFQQVEGAYPAIQGINQPLSRKTRGATIIIQEFSDLSGRFVARSGPTGYESNVSYDLICTAGR